MTIFTISPVVPDLKVVRAYPCSAIVDVGVECGATPAALYQRYCGVVGHDRKIWLCPIHATIAACGGAICQECAKAGGLVPVVLTLLSEPMRFT
jgi:hypothetical protein